jgi:hypothetical protein
LRSLSHGPCLYPAAAHIRRPKKRSGYEPNRDMRPLATPSLELKGGF